MKKSELIETLERLSLRPSRKLGQNFLLDDNLLDFIAGKSREQPGDMILEVGPGLGCLTQRLLLEKKELVAIEIDKRLIEYLGRRFRNPKFNLVGGDACRLDIPKIICEFRGKHGFEKWKCVANLPYSISTPFAISMAALERPPDSMLFLLQKDTAKRFAAGVSSPDYSAASVILQSRYSVKLLRSIPSQVFFPAPEVSSALVEFRLREDGAPANFPSFMSFVKQAFSRRRKKMQTNLGVYPGMRELFEAMGISENARAEELSPDEFVRLNLERTRRCSNAGPGSPFVQEDSSPLKP